MHEGYALSWLTRRMENHIDHINSSTGQCLRAKVLEFIISFFGSYIVYRETNNFIRLPHLIEIQLGYRFDRFFSVSSMKKNGIVWSNGDFRWMTSAELCWRWTVKIQKLSIFLSPRGPFWRRSSLSTNPTANPTNLRICRRKWLKGMNKPIKF